MQKIGLFFSLLFCFGNHSFSQSVYNTSPLLENIHLHLNKTTFIKGERLWFKAYIQNQQNKLPSFETRNLHVAIYDNEGIEVKRKLFYVQNGTANGDFAIDSLFTVRHYSILAWTSYQRNFERLKLFQQAITIIDDNQEFGGEDADDRVKIEVYPEGGNLIQDAFNYIGITTSRNANQRVSLNNLELVDELDNIVRSNISTNSLGLGKVGFMVSKGKKYFLRWGSSSIGFSRKLLPTTKSEEIGIHIDNNGKDNVLVKLIASKLTFKKKDGENYSMAIYQDDTILFEDVEINEEESVISLQRKSMPYGINTAVLFDSELKPISSRMFFNHSADNKHSQVFKVEYCLNEFRDSIQVDLILPNGVSEMNSSIAVLPNLSKAYEPENSLFSSFLVRPYLDKAFKGSYYFDQMDRKKRFELDKRLLIAGWGKYDWDSRKLEKLKLDFAMETGISVKGKILDADMSVENQVSLVTDFSGAYAFEELDNDKTFQSKMNLFEGDSLGISLIGQKGNLRKPKVEIQFSNLTAITTDIVGSLKFEHVISQNQNQEIDQSLNLSQRTIALDEVTVTEKALKTEKTPMFVPQGSLLPISEGRIIGDADIERYNSVMVYLARLGYSRSEGLDADGFRIPILLSPKGNRRVAVNGALLDLPLSRVQGIYFDVDKEVYVSIVLKSNAYVKPENRNKFLKFAIENGYARPQEYFTPNYPDYNTQVFQNYGAIDWKANVSVGSDIPTSVTLPFKGQNAIKLFVEGMSDNGELISQEETIRIPMTN